MHRQAARACAASSLAAFLTLSLPSAGNPEPCDSRLRIEAEYYLFLTGSGPVSIVAGDWNQDGRVDVATANEGSGSVSILMGAGGLDFGPPADVPVGASPRGLAAADLDRDGHPDLVSTGDFGLAILRGDGRGGFASSILGTAAGKQVVATDLNRDGWVDLMTIRPGKLVATMLRGFEVIAEREWIAHAEAIALGDLDEDGDPDLLTAELPGLGVRLNDGTGAFGPPTFHTSSCDPYTSFRSVATGDLDGDRHLDVVSVSPNPGSCGLRLLGRGDGSFRPGNEPMAEWLVPAPAVPTRLSGEELARALPATPPARAAGLDGDSHGVRGRLVPDHVPAGPHYIFLADLDRDGRDEAVTLGVERGREVMGRRSAGSPRAAVAADGDGDGRPELLVAGATGVTVHPGAADGWIRRQPRIELAEEPDHHELRDLNGDGTNDLVVSGENGVVVHLGRSDGLFHPAIGAPLGSGWFTLVDVNGDGRVDLLGERDLALGRGDGWFDAVGRYVPSRVFTLAAGDLDHDGKIDLATVAEPSRFPYEGAIDVWLGDGGGGFRPASRIERVSRGNLLLADLDRDGHLDLVSKERTGGRVFYGRGDGSFEGTAALPSDLELGRLEAMDLDQDGWTDVVATEGADGVVYRHRGRSFDRAGCDPVAVLARHDLDRDGRADAITPEGRVFLGGRDGSFRESAWVGPDGDWHVDDRDHDGRPDLVVLRTDDVDSDENSATILWNRTTANRAPETDGCRATVPRAWPPNHEWADVTIDGARDPDGDPVTITVTGITQDEPVEPGAGGRDGAPGPRGADAMITAGGARVRLERDGTGNGRVYVVRFVARDACGASAPGTVSVCIPHHPGAGCIDDGQRHDSLAPHSTAAESEAGSPGAPLQVRVSEGRRAEVEYRLDAAAPVELAIFDVSGRRLATLDSGIKAAGLHRAVWELPGTGSVYFARFRRGTDRFTRPIVAVR